MSVLFSESSSETTKALLAWQKLVDLEKSLKIVSDNKKELMFSTTDMDSEIQTLKKECQKTACVLAKHYINIEEDKKIIAKIQSRLWDRLNGDYIHLF